MTKRYSVSYFEAQNCLDLTEKINDFYRHEKPISIRDVAYLSEMRANRLNPQQATVYFVCVITYVAFWLEDAD